MDDEINDVCNLEGITQEEENYDDDTLVNGDDDDKTHSDRRWKLHIKLLKEYKIKHGDCLVPRLYKTDDGTCLGSWVKSIRSLALHIKQDRREQLDSLGFVWRVRASSEYRWERNIKLLEEYRKQHGDSLVPWSYKTSNGVSLGEWVSNIRSGRLRMNDLRREQLEALDFVWCTAKDNSDFIWNRNIKLLETYKNIHGHCMVPYSYKTDTFVALGEWVHSVRHSNLKLELRLQLDSLGFVWSDSESSDHLWSENIKALEEYKNEYGNCLVPPSFETDEGISLGEWVSNLRSSRLFLSTQCTSQLDMLDFVWSVVNENVENDTIWDRNVLLLRNYKTEFGNSFVPRSYKTIDGVYLGEWVENVRSRSLILAPRQRAQLDALDFVWHLSESPESRWDGYMNLLKTYKNVHGDCLVPKSYQTEDGSHLGFWVDIVRSRSARIPFELRAQLDAISFVWYIKDGFESRWDRNMRLLEKYKKTHGNCLVPKSYQVEDVSLGDWVSSLRSRSSRVSPEIRMQLDALGFVWCVARDTSESCWNRNIRLLMAYKDEHGHCSVPQSYRTEDGISLGVWASSVRSRSLYMKPERFAQLEALGFSWSSERQHADSFWDRNVKHLEAYKKEHGNCLVPQQYKTDDGVYLGEWVHNVRRRCTKQERRSQLDELDFVWRVKETSDYRWDRNVKLLEAYKEEFGDCLIPRSYKTKEGVALGVWVSSVRSRSFQIKPDRRTQLDALGFVWRH